jgi:hypothetical protein
MIDVKKLTSKHSVVANHNSSGIYLNRGSLSKMDIRENLILNDKIKQMLGDRIVLIGLGDKRLLLMREDEFLEEWKFVAELSKPAEL